jgi:hypothetical protein
MGSEWIAPHKLANSSPTKDVQSAEKAGKLYGHCAYVYQPGLLNFRTQAVAWLRLAWLQHIHIRSSPSHLAIFFCAWILEQFMGDSYRIGIGLSYRAARLHLQAESIPWKRFLGSLNFKNTISWHTSKNTYRNRFLGLKISYLGSPQRIYYDWRWALWLIKKENKIFSYIRKFREELLRSHIRGRAS